MKRLAAGTASLRALALFEAAKGALASLLAFGLLAEVRHPAQQSLIESAFAWAHLDPSGRLAGRVMSAVQAFSGTTATLAIGVALFYAGARLAEGWGLWHARRWARWLAVLSSAAFLPIEIEELLKHPSTWTVGVLVANLIVIGWLLRGLLRPSA